MSLQGVNFIVSKTLVPNIHTQNEDTSHFHSFASPSLAGSWDNVGLLVEPSPPHRVNSLLLTNDLTAPVMEEALQQKVRYYCWSLLRSGRIEKKKMSPCDRVATAQGKRGIWRSILPDREYTENLPKIIKNMFCTGNLTPTQG